MLEGKTEEAGEGFTSLILGQVMEVILPIRLENVPPVNNMRNILFLSLQRQRLIVYSIPAT